jgi:peroxiredoxin Q/BCP
LLTEGTKAPDVSIKIADGEFIKLSDLAGKKVVLYFYPKNGTTGCTKEAISMRNHFDEITARGAVVIGVSPDSVESHERFRKQHNLPFYLGSDPDHKVAEAFGAWGDKKMFGKVYKGIKRSTFIIDEQGVIVKVFDKVSTETHGHDVLAYL